MYPSTTTPDDIKKLQAEANQLRNQQFTLVTIGIATIALSSWMTSMLSTYDDKIIPQAAISIFLLALLCMLFIWSMALRRLIGIISSYLELRNASEWERHFRAFCQKRGSRTHSQTIALFLSYMFLGLVPIGEYVGLTISGKNARFWSDSTLAVMLTWGFYIFILSTLTARRGQYDKEVRDKWGAVLSAEFAGAELARASNKFG
jgi:hypothetical protein